MKKSVFILNIILSLAVVAGDVCYMLFGGLWLKSITSAGFVLIGIINLIYALQNRKTANMKYTITMLIGLIFAMCGDIVLNVNFIGGAILFAVGHIFFFFAYTFIRKFEAPDIVIGICVFFVAAIVILFLPIFDFGGILMQIVCLVYALIISLMVGKAFANLAHKRDITNFIIIIGSVLFFFSDFMLLLDNFAGLGAIAGILCLATYYPAECLLAHSIFQANNKKEETK